MAAKISNHDNPLQLFIAEHCISRHFLGIMNIVPDANWIIQFCQCLHVCFINKICEIEVIYTCLLSFIMCIERRSCRGYAVRVGLGLMDGLSEGNGLLCT